MSKKAKQIAAGFGIAAAAGLGVSAVRAATTFKPDKVDESQQLAPEKVDVQRYIDHLSRAIQIPTVSYRDVEKVDWAQFDAFHAFLKEAYPLIHEKLDLQIISRKSLMYHWASEHPEREPIAMLAHQDVVPISEGTEGDWEHPPFSGEVADGFIWGRGALDIKNHLIGVMEAVETLLEEGYVPERDVYLCFGHNEEVMAEDTECGAYCMMEWFRDHGIRLDSVIDEGGAILPVRVKGLIQRNLAGVGVAEKGHVDFEIAVTGKGGHSSAAPKHNALGELAKMIVNLENHQFKEEMSPQLWSLFNAIGRNVSYPARIVTCNLPLLKPLLQKIAVSIPQSASMMRTTTAVTMASASPAPNVLPQRAAAIANFRIMPGQTIEDVEKHIRKYCPGAEVNFIKGNNPSKISPTDSRAFKVIADICKKMGPENIVAPYLVMGGTDARNYEPVCDNIYRYSPFLVDTSLVMATHGTNERIPVSSLEDGVAFFKRYIRALTAD